MAFVLAGVVALALLGLRRQGGGRALAVVLMVLVGAVAVVGGGGFIGGGSGGAPAEPPAVSIAEPLDSTEVTGPVQVAVAAERLGRYHLHLAIDAPCVGADRVIPDDAAHRHLGPTETRLSLELPPGEHTLCLQAGDVEHRARPESHEITILVGPA